MKILDGKALRDEIKAKLKKEVEGFKTKPCLCIIQVGDRAESNAYIDSKKKFGESIGAKVIHEKYPADIKQSELIQKIEGFNRNAEIHGIIVQLPISPELDADAVVNTIAASKDVDGLGPENVKKLWEGKKDAFLPATTKGVVTLLEKNNIEIAGKDIVVVGRSSLVGKPTALALLMKEGTVTVAHKGTKDLKKHTKAADIIVVAAGKIGLITRDHVSPGQTIIDVGINPVAAPLREGMALQDEPAKRTLVGDVDFENVKDIVGAITPVPGGVGPMTVASLFENVLEAYKRSL